MPKKEILNNDALTVRVGESAVENAERALDVIEGKIETLENITGDVITVTKNNPWLLGAALVVGAGIGGFIAYKITQKRMLAWHEDDLREQIAMATSFQRRLAEKDKYDSPDAAAQALIPDEVVETLETYQGRGPNGGVAYNQVPPKPVETPDPPAPMVETPVEPVVSTAVDRNVFNNGRNNPRDWDFKAEVAAREENPDKPYVISVEEFGENPQEYDQQTVTYYEGDDTLADSRNQPIEEIDSTVGDDNLERFGHGSNDVNVVYVRNERLELDFEVIRDPGYYVVEVLGLDRPEKSLKHSQQRGRRHRADE